MPTSPRPSIPGAVWKTYSACPSREQGEGRLAIARPVAAVTGAGSGIGASIAAHLAPTHDLILTHLHRDQDFEQVIREAESSGCRVDTVTGDLSLESTREAFGETTDAHRDRLRVLVCNAGAYPRVSWEDVTLDHLRASLELHLTAHLACIQAVTPHMIQAGYGRIVAISSMLTQIGLADLVPYISAKGGLEALVHALARELGPHGVTVNTIRPGSIQVEAEQRVVPDVAAMTERQLAHQCIKRRGNPDDIAAAATFLASEAAGFITGQSLTVDGGWHLT